MTTKVQLADQDAWRTCLANNQDGYGRGVVTFAERWAILMQNEMAAGKSLEKIADDCSHEADTEGITGFMYGCAVSILASCWVHGDQLRRWHNLDTQIGTEGESANAKGTVLNPALLNVKTF